MQLSLYDFGLKKELKNQVLDIISIADEILLDAICKSIKEFQLLPKNQEYVLGFSGGKDSHVLLGIYILYLKLGNPPLDLIVKFADTKLEHESLCKTISLSKKHCEYCKIPFAIVQSKNSYWWMQFALGYPVPNHRNRWCTGKLKIQPMQLSKKIKSITGRHLGESRSRDQKLAKTSCGSDSCGSDLIKDKYDPLMHWRNCQIWDALFVFDSMLLYDNCFNLLQAQYEQAEDIKTGSLRMGCFMCPVISVKTIEQNYNSRLIDQKGVNIRYLLEELRLEPRINSAKTKNKGAIFIGSRRKYWKLLDKNYLLENKWIAQEDIDEIDNAIKSNYSYPPTYKKDWIDKQHEILTWRSAIANI